MDSLLKSSTFRDLKKSLCSSQNNHGNNTQETYGLRNVSSKTNSKKPSVYAKFYRSYANRYDLFFLFTTLIFLQAILKIMNYRMLEGEKIVNIESHLQFFFSFLFFSEIGGRGENLPATDIESASFL